jgi:hypothetical protein
MTKRRRMPPPGVFRDVTGKRWEAVVADKRRIILLGVYDTMREASARCAAYWKKRKSTPPAAA